jgi:extradiol dioxygenase family protein
MKNLFHLAFPVDDLTKAREFYGGVLGCEEGRSSDIWVDFNLFGHQIVAHKTKDGPGPLDSNPVDSDEVPVPHFGIVMEMEDWKKFAEMLKSKGVEFVIKPKIRFEGEIGEQATMFFKDPSGNALEFKAFNDFSNVFAND